MLIKNPDGFSVKLWLISSYSYSTVFIGSYCITSFTNLSLRTVV